MINVESKPGEGTTFHVYFPLIAHEEKQVEQEDEQQYPGTGGKILLVDDEEALAEITGEMLKMEGYQIHVQTDSTGALEVFKSNPDEYDLVITDHTMPIMTGVELAKELMRIRPGIPIILVTGYNQKITEASVLDAGIREFMYKPFDRKNLINTIGRIIYETRQEISV
jgi:CheY-like chemotaxis protein